MSPLLRRLKAEKQKKFISLLIKLWLISNSLLTHVTQLTIVSRRWQSTTYSSTVWLSAEDAESVSVCVDIHSLCIHATVHVRPDFKLNGRLLCIHGRAVSHQTKTNCCLCCAAMWTSLTDCRCISRSVTVLQPSQRSHWCNCNLVSVFSVQWKDNMLWD